MDEFALQRSLARHILKARPGVGAGMEQVISTLERKAKGLGWEKLRAIDWDKGLARWVAWIDALGKKLPPRGGLGLLWFEAPSELNRAMTSVSGWTRLGAKEDSYGMNEDRVWPLKKNGDTADAGLLELPELDKAWKNAGWSTGKASGGQADRLRPGVLATGFAYALLLVVNGLSKTGLAKSLGKTTPAGVLVGWADGDFEAVGGIKGGKWVAVPQVKRLPASAFYGKDGNLTLEYMFDARRYLEDGGDPKWRHRKTGETLLHAACRYCDDVKVIEMALDAGVDVNAIAKDSDGPYTFLDQYGAGSVDVIRLAAKRGAKLSDGRNRLRHYFDAVVEDGRCTVEHLHLLEELGVPVPKGSSPLHTLAVNSLYRKGSLETIREQLDFWLKRGQDINSRDKEGRTPLWVALHEHAQELAGHAARLKKGETHDDWDCRHDGVALELIARGADPNAVLKNSPHPLIPRGATPLMVRRYDDDKLVLALLKAGADPHATSAEGKTALDYAQAAAEKPKAPGHEGVRKVIAALTKAMAKKPGK